MKWSNKQVKALYDYLKKRRSEILKDDRYPKKKSDIATIDVNAPLSLIQLSMQTEVGTINKCLEFLK